MKRKKAKRAARFGTARPQVETLEVTEANYKDIVSGRLGPYIIAGDRASGKLIATKVPKEALPVMRAYVKNRFGPARG